MTVKAHGSLVGMYRYKYMKNFKSYEETLSVNLKLGSKSDVRKLWQHRDWVWFGNLLHGEQEAVGLCARYGPVCLGTIVAVVR